MHTRSPIHIVLPLVSVIAACAVGLPALEEHPPVIDHMAGFDGFLRELQVARTAEARRAAYDRHFVSRDSSLYASFVGDVAELSDAFVVRVTDRILLEADGIRAYHALARRQVPEAIAAAERAFGVGLRHVPVHLTLNLGQSNAQVRIHEGQVTILLGLDTGALTEDLVLPTTARDLRPLMVHELFHAYHWERNAFMASLARRFLPPRADAPLWVNIWSEGLASCAARIAYPGSDIALVMGIEGIWEDAEPRLPELASELRGDLDATDLETTGRWLFVELPERRDGLPNKAGYIIGSVAAHRIVEKYGLDGAAGVGGPQLRSAVDGAISSIAAGDLDVTAESLCAWR